jgi:hypothetical protein
VQEVVYGAGRAYVRGWLCGRVVQRAVVRRAKSRGGGTALGRVVDNIPRYTLTTRRRRKWEAGGRWVRDGSLRNGGRAGATRRCDTGAGELTVIAGCAGRSWEGGAG